MIQAEIPATNFRRSHLTPLVAGVLAWSVAGQLVWAAPQASPSPALSRLDVSLFGQKCQLVGPVAKSSLEAIHSISPEQVFLENQDRKPTKPAMEKLRKAAHVPPLLDSYREKLAHRIEGQLKFNDALASAKKSGKVETLLTETRGFISGRAGKEYEVLAQKLTQKNGISSLSPEATEQLRDSYLDAIEPDPEDEFHKGIQKLGVRYACDTE